MRVISDNTIRHLSESSVVTIGNFDGLHLGHQALVNRCLALKEIGQDVVVVTFDPSPQAWFSGASGPARLTSQRQKLALLEESGVDLVWTMGFNQELADMSAASFAESVIGGALSATRVVVGEDFRFGRKREGDIAMLDHLGESLGFSVEALRDVEEGGVKVSSTAIRKALAEGDFDLAARFLGRRFTMQGEVIQGTRLGRKLGYPTANMRPEAVPSPLRGVYAVRVRRLGDPDWYDAVASLGNRPAVGGKEFLVEVHLFDFSGDLYGQRLEVMFEDRIRDEEHFGCVEELVSQMKKDDVRARGILSVQADQREK